MDKYLFLRTMENAGYENQKSFAKEIGIPYKKLNNQLNGKSIVSTEDAARYCRALGINDNDSIVSIFFTECVPKKGHG